MSVAEFSIRRPVTTIMCFVSLVVIGLIASFRLPLEALPDISAPFLFVQIPYTGSTPEEVERTIIRPVEESLATEGYIWLPMAVVMAKLVVASVSNSVPSAATS